MHPVANGTVNASRDFAKDEELLNGKHFIIETIMVVRLSILYFL